MSVHRAMVDWTCEGDFLAGQYDRGHTLRFDGGAVVPGSPSPHVVPAPFSNAAAVDPEELFVAAISSCHMLWFLDHARQAGIGVSAYSDEAEGLMTRIARGKWAVTRVVLRPLIVTHAPVGTAQLAELHHRAHESCFIANSVTTEIVIEPR